MSLAEDVRRPFEASSARLAAPRQQRRPGAETPRVVASAVREPRVDPRMPEPAPSGDSLNLLDRASKSVVFLLERYRQLEEHVRQLDAWSKAQIQAAEAAATRWQDAAAESDRKVQDMQRSFDSLTRRAETAEQQLQRERQALSALQERIISAFGFGSEAHDALAAFDPD